MDIKVKTIYQNVEELKDAIRTHQLMIGDELVTSDMDGEAVLKVAHITKKKVWMIRKYLLQNEREMKYQEFDLLHWLGMDYMNSLPEEFVGILQKVTLPTEKQVFGKNKYGKEETRKQWDYFKNTKHRIATKVPDDDYSRSWWLRTPLFDEERDVVSGAYFALVGSYGNAAYGVASHSYGIRPAFAISVSKANES